VNNKVLSQSLLAIFHGQPGTASQTSTLSDSAQTNLATQFAGILNQINQTNQGLNNWNLSGQNKKTAEGRYICGFFGTE
jgi:hypothetical protein